MHKGNILNCKRNNSFNLYEISLKSALIFGLANTVQSLFFDDMFYVVLVWDLYISIILKLTNEKKNK